MELSQSLINLRDHGEPIQVFNRGAVDSTLLKELVIANNVIWKFVGKETIVEFVGNGQFEIKLL
jgi:hypothetical protein